MAGRLGFAGMTGEHLTNRFFSGGHSLYFEKSGQPNDEFMKRYWVPLILQDFPIETIDERMVPTWYQGFFTTVLQNFEIVKLLIYSLLLLAPAFSFALLYHEANLQRQRADEETRQALMQTQRAEFVRDEALATLVWAFNRSAYMPYNQFAFDEKTQPLMVGIFKRLLASGYGGHDVHIELRAHVGEFMTVKRRDGTVVLATTDNMKNLRPGDLVYGMTSEYALAIGQKAAESARRVASNQGTPDKMLEAESLGKEKPTVPYPKSLRDPEAWNRVAALNNRIEMKLCYQHITHARDEEKCIVDPAIPVQGHMDTGKRCNLCAPPPTKQPQRPPLPPSQ